MIPDLVLADCGRAGRFVLAPRTRANARPGSLSLQAVVAARVGGLLLRFVYGASFTDLSPFRAIRRDELSRSA